MGTQVRGYCIVFQVFGFSVLVIRLNGFSVTFIFLMIFFSIEFSSFVYFLVPYRKQISVLWDGMESLKRLLNYKLYL